MSDLVRTLTFLTAFAASSPAADLRIGVVGLDTFHVIQYLKVINDPTAPEHVTGGRIVAGYVGGSPDVEMSRQRLAEVPKLVVERYGVRLYDSIEELARSVDAIMIESIDGRPHLEQFRRTLATRRPVFIDKPFAGSLRDAVEIVRLARENRIPCFSSSSLRFTYNSPLLQRDKIGEIRSAWSFGPADTEPHHPDLFWYGVHAVEALYTVMGTGCVQVVRTTGKSTDIVTGLWHEGQTGTVQGNRGIGRGFGITVFGTKGTVSGGDKQSLNAVAREVMKFFQTGKPPVALEETLELFAFMEAADESKRRGGAPVKLAEMLAAAGAPVAK